MDKVKKYFLVGLVSIILLGALYIFSNNSLTGHFVYTIPEDRIVLSISQNDVPLSFFKCDNILSGKFKFNLVQTGLLPADKVLENGNTEPVLYADLSIFNYSSSGIYNYIYKKSITLREFMDKANPKIETVPLQLGGSIEGIMGGTLSIPITNFNIYNTTDPDVLSNNYEYDLSNFNINLPPPGNYSYSLNLTLHYENNYSGYYVFFRNLSVLDKNCYVPTLIEKIHNLTFNGGSEEGFLDLSNYFRDAGGDVLTYTISGGHRINLTVVNGKVDIAAPYDYGLNESFYIIASDGINSTTSNLFSITIVEEALSGGTGCSPNWSISDWGECNPDSIRTRVVIDINSCSGNITRPSEVEGCSYSGGGEPLTTSSPETQNPENLPKTKKESIFDNKLLLSGIVLGFFLLLILILLLLDWLRKRKSLIAKPKEKPHETPVAEYKPKFETPVKQVKGELNLVNSNELNKYVEDMLDKGASVESISEKLNSSGWNKEQAEDAISFVRVKKFVDKMLEKGQSREAVRKLLKDKGWKDEFINRVLK